MNKTQLAHTNHIAFRLPNWLGDICMALPVIKAIQAKARIENPDVSFSFLMRPQYVSLLNKLDISGEMIALPAKNWRYFFKCLQWRGHFDVQIMFTNSERGDIESWLMKTPCRLGIARPKKSRKFLTDRYSLSDDFNEEALHQTMLWRDFVSHFGLLDEMSVPPIYPISLESSSIGLICGSANTPEKRWAVDKWQDMIRGLMDNGVKNIVLFGTKEDAEVCHKIASIDTRIQNMAGKTGLDELVDLMRAQSLVVGNDTGGIHLANALGVPVVGLYGLTNPVRSRPIHDAPLITLQSPKGYGEGRMEDITVEQVLSAIQVLLERSRVN